MKCWHVQSNHLWQHSQHSIFLLSHMNRVDMTIFAYYISGRATCKPNARATSTLHFRSLESYLGATITSSPHKKPLIRTSSFRYEPDHCVTFELSQLTLCEAGHHTKLLSLEPPLSSREVIPFLQGILSTFLVKGADSFPSWRIKTWDREGAYSFAPQKSRFHYTFVFRRSWFPSSFILDEANSFCRRNWPDLISVLWPSSCLHLLKEVNHMPRRGQLIYIAPLGILD